MSLAEDVPETDLEAVSRLVDLGYERLDAVRSNLAELLRHTSEGDCPVSEGALRRIESDAWILVRQQSELTALLDRVEAAAAPAAPAPLEAEAPPADLPVPDRWPTLKTDEPARLLIPLARRPMASWLLLIVGTLLLVAAIAVASL